MQLRLGPRRAPLGGGSAAGNPQKERRRGADCAIVLAVPRVVELPDRGRLFVATDLQGNLRDFQRIASLFEQAAKEPDGAVLVLTGDLIHGPEIPQPYWPEYLGSYFSADSTELLRQAEALADKYRGHVHYLLGNHEHAHVGGPVVSKFFPNEALRLERLMGREMTRRVHRWFESWPLVAVAREAGMLMMHAAPNATIRSGEDLERIRFRAQPPGAPPHLVDETLAEILWARTTSTARARAFLDALGDGLNVVVYGHDVVREGHLVEREPLLCVSSSFGCFDGDKMYVEWKLSERAESAEDLVERGLRPLYPDQKPVYREPRSDES